MDRERMVKCRRRAGVRVQEVGDEMLVLDEVGQIHQLNPTASFIWRQCDGNASVVEIARLLASEFEVQEEVAAEDVVTSTSIVSAGVYTINSWTLTVPENG